MTELLKFKIFEYDAYFIQVVHLVKLIVFILLVTLILFIIKQVINRSTKINRAKKYSIYSLFKYFILIISSVIGLQILGLNLSIFLAGSAALLVGVGLGIQNLFNDYISGLIILFDSTIKVGDIIEVNNLVCEVKEINLRTSLVLTRDDKYLILPNSYLTSTQIINWTHNAIASRFDIKVGVAYSSDINLVKKLLIQSLDNDNRILKNPNPFVRMLDHGESALEFGLYFWTNDVFRVENIKSEIREKLTQAFRANSVEIPFPQRVVHTINKD
ncbi:MAG: mechanosensitive ion channel [Leptospira sp.]|nr:mechanosensitive ion channel [Leptospira sp.]NCS92784.1 mechanosensitive ion channel [Leptospira sp.]